jgi:hypothetical protein
MAMVDVSDGACRMLGFSREALLRIDPVALGLAERASSSNALADPAAIGAVREHDIVETELLRADGQGACRSRSAGSCSSARASRAC